MRVRIGLAIVGLLACVSPASSRAQTDTNMLGRTMHACTFNRPCNWTAHAAIAFGATYGLRALHVPTAWAAGTAALLFVGKELRDQMKWGVLGTADSNGDLVSGLAGALLAYHVSRHSRMATRLAIAVDAQGRAQLAVRLRAP
jgi:hypothetical protein